MERLRKIGRVVWQDEVRVAGWDSQIGERGGKGNHEWQGGTVR